MTGTPETAAAWQRLGKLLQDRRVEIDPRYASLTLFAAERGINYRLAWDTENAARTNFRTPTLRAIEAAYGWEPGSADDVLSGGAPRPLRRSGTPASVIDALAALPMEDLTALFAEAIKRGMENQRGEGERDSA